MAASVVDFPCPVGPVTSTNPCLKSVKLLAIGGKPNESISGISKGILLNEAAIDPFWV